MKKTTLLCALMFSITCLFAQKKEVQSPKPVDSVKAPSMLDTVYIDNVKYLKSRKTGNVMPAVLVNDASYVLTRPQVESLFDALTKLPYIQSAAAIEVLKKFFNL